MFQTSLYLLTSTLVMPYMMVTLYVAFLALNDGPVTCINACLIPLVMRKLALFGHPGPLS